jgi:hypothetical protein
LGELLRQVAVAEALPDKLRIASTRIVPESKVPKSKGVRQHPPVPPIEGAEVLDATITITGTCGDELLEVAKRR